VRPAPLALLFALSLFAQVAEADGESDAKDLFTRGRERRIAGDCAGAVDLFRRALDLYPAGLGSLRNLAECEESLGHPASSWRAWIDLKRALVVNRDPKYAGWEEDAEAGAARLATRVAKLAVQVTVRGPEGDGPPPPDARLDVRVNDEPLPRALWGTELVRDPGTYRVRVEGADAAQAVEQVVELRPGPTERAVLHLALRRPPELAPSPAPPPSPRGLAVRRAVGWSTIGLGAASLAASAVTFAVRQRALSDLRAGCADYATAPCPPGLRSTVDRGQLASTLTTGFLVAGGALAASGAALVVFSPSSRGGAATTAPAVAITVGPGRVDAAWTF
jgi:hypothetical protein